MNTSKKDQERDPAVKVSISLPHDQAKFLEDNKAVLGGNLSRAVQGAIKDLMQKVKEDPASYTVRPIFQKKK